MRSSIAFMKKEWLEQLRSGRLTIMGIVFVLLGIMSPAIAKLTPWMMEMMASSLEQSGMTITAVEVDALTSWVQFFKNVPMGLIAFLLLQSSIFTGEYGSGTLVLTLTKGLARYKVVLCKTVVLLILWTACYWTCFGITYGYNAYFWDNSIAHHLSASVVFWWLLGIWAVMLMVLFSTVADQNIGVLAGTGGGFLASYLLGMIPKCKDYVPTALMDGNALIYGTKCPEDYTVAAVITVLLSLLCLAMGVVAMERKRL